MIHVILRGDFGNQLFQYALARKLALQHDAEIEFILSNRLSLSDWNGSKLIKKLSCFQLPVQYRVFPPLDVKFRNMMGGAKSCGSGLFHREEVWGFDPQVLELPDDSYLFGFFQSDAYFKGIASIIRQDLTIKNAVSSPQISALEGRLEDVESVSVHVRRGDYMKSPGHNVCNLDYFAKAAGFIKEKLGSPHFFVFSDDIEWCKANMNEGCFEFVDSSTLAGQPITDFRLMGLCKHNIISNSSFSWWAAWLNGNPDKIVVSPNSWHNDEVLNKLAVRDTIPADWVKIDF